VIDPPESSVDCGGPIGTREPSSSRRFGKQFGQTDQIVLKLPQATTKCRVRV